MRNEIHAAGDADFAGNAEHASHRSTGASAVSRDMEAIFGQAAPAGVGGRRHAAGAIVPIILHDRKAWRRWRGRAPILGLAGAVIASGAAWMSLPPQAPVFHSAQDKMDMARPALPRPPPPQVRLDLPSARPSSVSVEPAHKPAITSRKRPSRISAPDRPKPTSARRPAIRTAPCGGLRRPKRARCLRSHLIKADLQLRQAYASATRAGVDPRKLNSYNRRWSQLLGKATSNPAQVTRQLRKLTQKVNAAQAARSGGVP